MERSGRLTEGSLGISAIRPISLNKSFRALACSSLGLGYWSLDQYKLFWVWVLLKVTGPGFKIQVEESRVQDSRFEA